MYLKKTILLLLTCHVCLIAYTQQECTSVFSGQVLSENDAPIIGASIVLSPQQIGQATDSLGNFRFTNLCNGQYQAKVQYLGYQDVEFNLRIKGETTRVIRLKELNFQS